MQGQPTPSRRQEILQGGEFSGLRDDIAGVRDEKIGGSDCIAISVVLRHPDPDMLLFAEQLQELQACVVHVVVKPPADKVAVHWCRCHERPSGDHNCTRLVKPLSAMIFAPVIRLAAGLATNTMMRAISSTVPIRPHGICFMAQS